MAVIGRTLEAQSQGDYRTARLEQRKRLHEAGQAESILVLRLTTWIDGQPLHQRQKNRSDDAYTAGGMAGKRPDRATLIYTQRAGKPSKTFP